MVPNYRPTASSAWGNWSDATTSTTTGDTTNTYVIGYYYEPDPLDAWIKCKDALDRIIDTVRYFHPHYLYWTPYYAYKQTLKLSVLLRRWIK